MTLVLIEKDLVFEGLTFKNRGYLGSRYIIVACMLLVRLSPGQSSERRYISVRKNPIFDGGYEGW